MVHAENSFTITKSLFMEGMTRVLRESYGGSLKKAVAFLGAAWLLMAVVTAILKASPMYLALEAVVVCFAAFWLYEALPRSRARRAYRNFEGKNGEELRRTTRFFDDHLVVEGVGVETAIQYGDIREVLRSRRLLVLVTEDKTGVLLALDGFTTGSADYAAQLISKGGEQ